MPQSKFLIAILLLAGFLFLLYLFYSQIMDTTIPVNVDKNQIKYVAVGDSYTIGLGVKEDERWPEILTEKLRKDGLDIVLVKNLAISGYTTQDALDSQVLELKNINPDFVTVLIGANDSFRELDKQIVRQNVRNILDKTQSVLKDPKKVIVLTVPNYAVSPQGRTYGANEETEKQIEGYNEIIKVEAEKRGLKVVDLFKLTSDFSEANLFIDDGLHPSGIQYQKWADFIYPEALKLLR